MVVRENCENVVAVVVVTVEQSVVAMADVGTLGTRGVFLA